MSKYRKKPIVVHAQQYLDGSVPPPGVFIREDSSTYVITIHGQETEVTPGDPRDLERLTLSPSVYSSGRCGWHGFIRNGVAESC